MTAEASDSGVLEPLMPASVSDDDLRTLTLYSVPCETVVYPPEVTTQDQLNVVEASGTLDFWDDEEEDVY